MTPGNPIATRQMGHQTQLLIYLDNGRRPDAKVCEELGEDHGMYEPKIEDLHGLGSYKHAVIVSEGFTGDLCDHEWGMKVHFGRNPFGWMYTCKKCGLKVSENYRKRSPTVTFVYDVWTLREHIWRNWLKRGPTPGSLSVQEYHR